MKESQGWLMTAMVMFGLSLGFDEIMICLFGAFCIIISVIYSVAERLERE